MLWQLTDSLENIVNIVLIYSKYLLIFTTWKKYAIIPDQFLLSSFSSIYVAVLQMCCRKCWKTKLAHGRKKQNYPQFEAIHFLNAIVVFLEKHFHWSLQLYSWIRLSLQSDVSFSPICQELHKHSEVQSSECFWTRSCSVKILNCE